MRDFKQYVTEIVCSRPGEYLKGFSFSEIRK